MSRGLDTLKDKLTAQSETRSTAASRVITKIEAREAARDNGCEENGEPD